MKIIMPEEKLPTRPVFVVIYGLPGVGKTSLSFTSGVAMHTDWDRGVTRAVQHNRPITIMPETWASFKAWIYSQEALDFITDNGINSIIVDTVGAMLEDFMTLFIVTQNVKNGNGSGGLGLSGWGALGSEFGSLKARLQEMNCHLVCLAHAKESEDDGKTKMRLAIKGGSADILYRNADLIGYMDVQNNERVIQFAPTPFCIGKDTGNIGKVVVPDAMTAPDKFNTFLADIIKQTQDFMDTDSEAQKALKVTLDDWANDIKAVDSPAAMTALAMSALEEDSPVLKAHLRTMMSDRVKELGYKWDKDSKAYIDPSVPVKETKPAKAAKAKPQTEEE